MLSRRTRNKECDDRGVVALEMVLVLPILITLIFGVVVLGNYLGVRTQTMGFARDGAREAALGKPLPVKDGVVFTMLTAACPDPPEPELNLDVTVQATKAINVRSIPFVPTLLPAEWQETVTMRCGG
jgi:Flp pilus assembly protein TadG